MTGGEVCVLANLAKRMRRLKQMAAEAEELAAEREALELMRQERLRDAVAAAEALLGIGPYRGGGGDGDDENPKAG